MSTAEFLSDTARTRRSRMGRGGRLKCDAPPGPRRRSLREQLAAPEAGADDTHLRSTDDAERAAVARAAEDRGESRRRCSPGPATTVTSSATGRWLSTSTRAGRCTGSSPRGSTAARPRKPWRRWRQYEVAQIRELQPRGPVLHRGLLRRRQHRLRVGTTARRSRRRGRAGVAVRKPVSRRISRACSPSCARWASDSGGTARRS